MILTICRCITLLIACSVFGRTVWAAAPGKPNIIIMMADDMGFSDIGCYGGEIETPTLNAMAKDGLRFTQFYNTGRCCPTRASLLTGLYPHQAGVGHMMSDRGLDGYRGNLNKNCRTIAEVLQTAGYSTYISGKWHLTRHIAPEGPQFNWPLQRGFDRFFGTIHGAGSFYDPNSLTRGNTQIVPDDDFYYTDAIADNASAFIAEHDFENPFFMYVSFTAPHWPMHARESDIAKYKGRYDDGWDKLRAERHRRQLDMGLVDPKWDISPRDARSPDWQKIEAKDWQTRRMEVYAAMVDVMDQGIGRIVQQLKKSGQYENTLLLFLADNGGCAEEYGSRGDIKPDPSKPTKLQPMKPGELQTRMQPLFTRDGRPVRTGFGVMPGPADTYIAYGLPWANASNTPFREYKHWVHEGGISSPLVVHWPSGIDEKQHGKLFREPAHLIDLMATCVDLGGASYPQEVDSYEIIPMQGVSLRPALNGRSLGRSTPIFWEHEGNRAMREGDWKLVAKGARGAWELYDIAADRTELHNLADKYPDRASQMADAWEAWAVDAKAKPWPYANKKPARKSAKKKT